MTLNIESMDIVDAKKDEITYQISGTCDSIEEFEALKKKLGL